MRKKFTFLFRKPDHSLIYFILLTGLAVSLPVSEFTTSNFEILLFLNWIIEGQFNEKLRLLKQRRSLWLILSVYMVHLLAMSYTSDLGYGLHDLRIKIPLLILPLIIGTSEPIPFHRLRITILFFTASVLVNSLISMAVLLGFTGHTITDIRQISIFISHIRFSLMINISIFSLIYLLLDKDFKISMWIRMILGVTAAWLVIFLFLLQSITGIVIFMVTGMVLFLLWMKHLRHLVLRWTILVFMLTIPLIFLSYITRSIARFYSVEQVDMSGLDTLTPAGNYYYHEVNNRQIENGHYVWIYVCEKELKDEWNKRSRLDYHGKDYKGQDIKYTLIRYLASMGYRKDSVGVARLTDTDISNIENGFTNHIFTSRIGLYPKIYEVIWQIDMFRKGGNPSGHSVTQRLLYLEAAATIIRDNWLVGVGTGDILDAYRHYYQDTETVLEEKWRLRAHNQYLTFMVTFGVIGFVWIFLSLILPVFMEKKWKNYFFILFFLVGFLSMLNEDTLETHIGVSFFAYFYALFLLGVKNEEAGG